MLPLKNDMEKNVLGSLAPNSDICLGDVVDDWRRSYSHHRENGAEKSMRSCEERTDREEEKKYRLGISIINLI